MDSSYRLISFKILPNGYEVVYERKQITFIFELDWNLNVRRRQSKNIVVVEENGEVDSQTRNLIINLLNSRAALRRFKSIKYEKIYKVGINSYRVIFSTEFNNGRIFQYELILNGDPNTSSLNIEEVR